MIMWKKMSDRPLSIFRTKKDFILTGRRAAAKELIFREVTVSMQTTLLSCLILERPWKLFHPY